MYDVEEDFEEPKPNPCRTCCYYIWKLVSCIFSHIILVSLVVAYCILGAFTFESLESGHEVQVKAQVSAFRTAVSNRLWNMTKNVEVLRQENWTREVKEYLKDFETDLLTAMKKNGWDGTEDQEVTQWTFAGALFYSIIVITTIDVASISKTADILSVWFQVNSQANNNINNDSECLEHKKSPVLVADNYL